MRFLTDVLSKFGMPLRMSSPQKDQEGLNVLQQELGQKAFAAIEQAALANTTHCQQHRDAGPMWVGKIPQNGIVYSVTVYLSGSNGWYGGREDTMYFALQFDIDTRGDKIYVQFGRYGPSEAGTVEDFDRILARACDHVKGWQLYRIQAA